MPLGWKMYKRTQKDVDACWTKKYGKNYFGYNLHAGVDKRYKLLRKTVVTNAAVADTTVFEPLLESSNASRDLYFDRGYSTAEREATLKQGGRRVHIQRKGRATKGILDTQKKRNCCIATSRARAKHVSSALAPMGGKLVRCAGVVRVICALHLKVASYNLKRLVYLKENGLAPF